MESNVNSVGIAGACEASFTDALAMAVIMTKSFMAISDTIKELDLPETVFKTMNVTIVATADNPTVAPIEYALDINIKTGEIDPTDTSPSKLVNTPDTPYPLPC